jgi:hypothetical protein
LTIVMVVAVAVAVVVVTLQGQHSMLLPHSKMGG